ncbi:hypothetical protein D9M73_83020 [compost metagenome]
MISKTGHEKRSIGLKKPASPWPLVNHTAISLSRYMRVRVLTMEMKSESVRMVGRRPSVE